MARAFLASALAAALMLSATPATASEAPAPANDRRAEATVIEAVPFRDVVDTTAATSDADDRAECHAGGGSVWYALTPAVDLRVDVKTYGSNYDTVLEIQRADTGAVVGCNDDGGFALDSRLIRDFTAGVTYLIRVAGYSQDDAGTLRLSLDEWVPLQASITLADTGKLTPGGRAVIDFTTTCNKTAYGYLDVDARQGLGPTVMTTNADVWLECGQTQQISMRLTPTTGSFLPGLLDVEWSSYLCSEGYGYDSYYDSYSSTQTAEAGDAASAAAEAGEQAQLLSHEEEYSDECVAIDGAKNVLLIPSG